MARPIPLALPPRDPREALRARLDAAPMEHAEALLAAYEVLQELHDRNVLDLLRGALYARDRILEQAVATIDAPEAIRGLRNLVLLAKAFGALEPELFAGLTRAVPEALVQAHRSHPGLGGLLRSFWNPDFRRGLAAMNSLLETLGRHLAAGRRP